MQNPPMGARDVARAQAHIRQAAMPRGAEAVTRTVTVAIDRRPHPITLTPVNPSGWDLLCVECGASMWTPDNDRSAAIRTATTDLHALGLSVATGYTRHEEVSR